jgi:transposase
MRTTLSNQIRGLLKTFGVVLTPGRGQRFQQLVEAALPNVGPIRFVISSLLTLWQQVGEELKQFDREVDRQARASAACRRLMSVPGVGSLTAVAYVAMIDNPARFTRSADVGAYLGLTPKRYQSGIVDRQGSISKCGDRLVRAVLFEAAAVLLSRIKTPSALRAWGLRLVARIGLQKARVAVARKLAVLLHHLWITESTFVAVPQTV